MRVFKWCCRSLVAVLFFGNAVAQQSSKPMPYIDFTTGQLRDATGNCGVDLSLISLRKNPAYLAKEAAMNRQIINYQRPLNIDSTVLPVVFHIIHQDPLSVNNQVILDALTALNDAFAKRGNYATSMGVDTKIRFCLSQKDPDGGTTTGITRTKSFFSTHLNPVIEDARLKNLVQWDPARYINIWYVTGMDMEGFADFLCGAWSRTAVAGYATLPPGGNSLDGIVVSGFGNLLTHEMGHYLGLYHTFEGRNCVNNNCAMDGDRVCDTPPDRLMSNSSSCTNPDNSCNTDTLSNYSNGNFSTDVPDQISNFMDYGNSACHNQFTQGQADRMLAAINTQRSGLLQNQCDRPCTENIIAGFSRNIAYPIPGNAINFTNTSTGAGNYQWLVNDILVATTGNFSYTFPAVGKYKVTLKAYNTITCFSTATDYIIVNCGVTARFYTNKRIIASKIPVYADSITFTNTSENATSFQWLMSNDKGMAEQVVSTGNNLVYVFPVPGNYQLRLIATNGSCIDTTTYFPVPVDEPTQDGVAYMTTINCYQQTKVRVTLFACNNGYATIPAKTPISFYDADPRQGNAKKLGSTFFLPDSIRGKCCGFLYTHIIDVQQPGLNQLYMVFNDSGKVQPLVLPNTTLQESVYTNNISLSTNFRFNVTVVPALSTLEPGDTLQLVALAGPGAIASYAWSPPLNLNCTSCRNPSLIADSNRVKQLIATSQLGCVDTAYATIIVPPSDDFSIELNRVECAGSDSLFVNFTLRNAFKRGVIRKGLVVSFYNSDPWLPGSKLLMPSFIVAATINQQQFTFSSFIKAMPPGKLYAVVNDSGTTFPLSLPNTAVLEKVYSNNVFIFDYSKLTAAITPATAVLEPGDTLLLTASSSPGLIASYTWSNSNLLNCINCRETELVADSTRSIQVIAMNPFGCVDTAFAVIQVPPANDYTISINDVQCAAGDKLYVNITLYNSFKRGVIPLGLTVAFYDGDPALPSSRLLPSLFAVPDTAFAKQFTYEFFISGVGSKNIYAVVNDSGKVVPVQLPVNLHLPEKNYSNNVSRFSYMPEAVKLQPADTTVFRKTSFSFQLNTPVYNAAATRWFNGNGYTLSCTQCPAPVITVFDSTLVTMQMENKYGCLIKGTATVNVFPPDITLRIASNTCYTNTTTLVSMEICMNNNYDGVFAGLPVAFYDGDPAAGGKLLLPVFVTPQLQPGNCATYQHIVATPTGSELYAVVNDKGTNTGPVPSKQFNETDYSNNTATTTIIPFNVSILPADTSLLRLGSVLLTATATGGIMSAYAWQQNPSLSCLACSTTLVNPTYTSTYRFVARNGFGCTDTAYANVKTFTGGLIQLPTAFSPNNDGRNDYFYVLAAAGIPLIKRFAVYNRWGQQIFESRNFPPNDPRFGWDGQDKGNPAAPGTYVYLVTLPAVAGKEQVLKGSFLLLR